MLLTHEESLPTTLPDARQEGHDSAPQRLPWHPQRVDTSQQYVPTQNNGGKASSVLSVSVILSGGCDRSKSDTLLARMILTGTMTTSVVNVRVASIRPLGYDTLKAWIADSSKNAYIGRAGMVFVEGARFPLTGSPFANPYKIGKDGTREEVLTKYHEFMMARLEDSEELVDKLLALRGKNLGCWCAPEPCHGNVLVELMDLFGEEKNEEEDDDTETMCALCDSEPAVTRCDRCEDGHVCESCVTRCNVCSTKWCEVCLGESSAERVFDKWDFVCEDCQEG